MSAHRIFVALFSVVLVAMSVFAVQRLLFAQEGGQVCEPGGSDVVQTVQVYPSDPTLSLWKTEVIVSTTSHEDGSCVDVSVQGCNCTAFTTGPRKVVKNESVPYTRMSVYAPWEQGKPTVSMSSTGTYTECVSSW